MGPNPFKRLKASLNVNPPMCRVPSKRERGARGNKRNRDETRNGHGKLA
jgi:hypothetical protein